MISVINSRDIEFQVQDTNVLYILKKIFDGSIKYNVDYISDDINGIIYYNVIMKDCDITYVQKYVDIIKTVDSNYRTYKTKLKKGFLRGGIEYNKLSDNEYKDMIKEIILKCEKIIKNNIDYSTCSNNSLIDMAFNEYKNGTF